MTKPAFFLLMLAGAIAVPFGCTTTSIDAVSGGASAVGGISVGVGPSTIGSSTAAGGPYPQSPCGSFYDWASCSVADGSHAEMTVADAEQMLVGAWRRCNEDMGGTFPIGVHFTLDGTVYRLFRAPNPGSGTQNIVFCSNEDADQGVWSVEENTGGGSSGLRLDIAWDDGAESSAEIVFYEGVAAFGLLAGEVDDDQTERFIPEADFIPGSEP